MYSASAGPLHLWAWYEQAKASPAIEHLAVQSLRDHLSVHDGDVHKEEQDDKEIVHEPQETEKGLWEDVERRHQVGECADEAEEDSDPEHPEEATNRKHLPKGMTQQGGHISQPVHKLGRQGRENIRQKSVLNIDVLMMHFISQYDICKVLSFPSSVQDSTQFGDTLKTMF